MIHTNPLALFTEWYAAAQAADPRKHRGAVCVSTIDEQGFPDGRFVDLKAASEEGFIFCTHLDSHKGSALARNPRAALTFWWDHLERQVRVVGQAERIADAQADSFFQERSRDAQLTSWTSQQSAPLDDPGLLDQRLRVLQEQFAGKTIPRPENWGGYCIVPLRIEFLTFKANRLHERLLFFRNDQSWNLQWLQP
jgi:pyridoxamine 5'-phosphate oxidase